MLTISESARGASAYTEMTFGPIRPSRTFDPPSSLRTPADDGWAERIDNLLIIRSYEEDWDGQGAEVPPPAVVDGAILLAQRLQSAGRTPPDRVVAGPNGTVSFEWHSPVGYTEIEVTGPTTAQVVGVRAGEPVAVLYDVPTWG